MSIFVETKNPSMTRRPGRPTKPGSKRSNPEYRPWSGLLRGQFVREADIVLKQTDDPRDMSDLITELLGKWVNERKPVEVRLSEKPDGGDQLFSSVRSKHA